MKQRSGSSVWNTIDLQNIMAALAMAAAASDNDDWRAGYVAALTGLALAIGVDRELLALAIADGAAARLTGEVMHD